MKKGMPNLRFSDDHSKPGLHVIPTSEKRRWFSQKRLFFIGILMGLCLIMIWWFSGRKDSTIPDTPAAIPASQSSHSQPPVEQNEPSRQQTAATSPTTSPSSGDVNLPGYGVEHKSSVPSEKEICAAVDKLISGRKLTEALQLVIEYLENDLPAEIRERVLLYKGNLLFALGKHTKAYEIYDQLLLEGKREDVRGWSVVKLYVLARQLDRIDETLTAYQNRLGMQPDDTSLTATLADLYAYHRQPDKEIEFRTRLLDDDPANIDNAMKLIAAYQQLKKTSEAAEVCSRLAKMDSANEATHLLRQANFFYNAQDTENAARVCDTAVQSATVNARNLLHCGYLYEQLGMNKQAINAFEKGAKIATEQYRQERCFVESLRIKQLQEKLSSSECSALEKLANHARAQGVRSLAKTVLDKSK